MKPVLRAALAAIPLLLCASAFADDLGQHPHYLHALSDLRAAQWQVDHRRPEDGQIMEDEMVVSDEVAAAIQAVSHAAMADGKDMNFTPPPDANPGYAGRLHAAIDLMRRAREDVARQEDDAAARGAQRMSVLHIDAALHAADRAINGVRREDSRE